MSNLTDELKIINASITFATENNLDYLILRCPTNTPNIKKVEINIGKGIQFKKPDIFFGVYLGIKKDGSLKYRQIHVYYPIGNERWEKDTEEFRKYLEKEFPEFECKW